MADIAGDSAVRNDAMIRPEELSSLLKMITYTMRTTMPKRHTMAGGTTISSSELHTLLKETRSMRLHRAHEFVLVN